MAECCKHTQHTQPDKPRLELAQVFRRYWDDYLEKHHVSDYIKQVVGAIKACRTKLLGGHRLCCDNPACDYQKNEYNSCRNRHCPKCQGSKRVKWVRNRLQELLPIPYFHLVFTLPHILNPLARFNKRVIFDIFFKAAAYTLNRFAQDPQYLGAQLGFTGILHTWGQALPFHVHLHFIVSGGGLDEHCNRWVRLPYQEKFLFPVEAMSRTIRKKFVELLEQAYQTGRLYFPGELKEMATAHQFEHFCQKVGNQAWVNYAKKPFAGPEKVVEYIGRYTHRVAISNHRLLDIENNQVAFSYKDYKGQADEQPETKIMRLSAEEFIGRFLMHILPKGFRKIRHYGFLAPGYRTEKLKLAQRLLASLLETSLEGLRQLQACIDRLEAYLTRHCPKCKTGTLVCMPVPIWDSS